MEFKIDSNDLEEFVRNAVMKSALGGSVEKVVNETLNRGYDSPLKKGIEIYISDVTQELIRDKLGDSIKALIASAIEEKLTEDLTRKLVNAAVEKIAESLRYY
jgi:hypothetical protein